MHFNKAKLKSFFLNILKIQSNLNKSTNQNLLRVKK